MDVAHLNFYVDFLIFSVDKKRYPLKKNCLRLWGFIFLFYNYIVVKLTDFNL